VEEEGFAEYPKDWKVLDGQNSAVASRGFVCCRLCFWGGWDKVVIEREKFFGENRVMKGNLLFDFKKTKKF
jgi:hypothetical protein